MFCYYILEYILSLIIKNSNNLNFKTIYQARSFEYKIITKSNPLIDYIPFPIHYFNTDNYSEHPYLCNNFHPIISTKISDIQRNIENIIFNDIIQEGILFECYDKFLYLCKKFINNSNSYKNLVINLIRLITEPNYFFQHLNKILCNQITATFLGTLVFTLNNAIRNNFKDIKFEKRVFRKAFISDKEISEYHLIFKSDKKRFFWESFISCYAESSEYLNTNEYNFNAIFIIDFSEYTFGIDISKISESNIDGEILLPAMSLFEIRNITKIQNNQGMDIIQIEVFKIDQNHLDGTRKTLIVKEKDFTKVLKIVENELMLLKLAEKYNYEKYTFFQDEENFFLIKFAINGSKNSNYYQGLFHVNVEIPVSYPSEAPSVNFMTKIWHPNINNKTGVLKHEFLSKRWKPSYTLVDLIECIIKILEQPDIFNSNIANHDASEEFFSNKKAFELKAKEMTQQYANVNFEEKNNYSIYNMMSINFRKTILKNDLLCSININNFNNSEQKNEVLNNDKFENCDDNRDEIFEKEESHKPKNVKTIRIVKKKIIKKINNELTNNILIEKNNEKDLKLYNENLNEENENFQMKKEEDLNVIKNFQKRKVSDSSGIGSLQIKKQHLNYEVDFDSNKDLDISGEYI